MKKSTSIILMGILWGITLLKADVFIKEKKHTGEMNFMGQYQAPKDQITEMWISDTQMLRLEEKNWILIDGTKQRMFLIDPTRKNYSEIVLPLDLKNIIDTALAQKKGDDGMQIMKSTLENRKMTVKVTPNDQTKEINSRKCSGFLMETEIKTVTFQIQIKLTLWATTDLPFNLEKFLQLYQNIWKMQMFDDISLTELKKINGFPILSEGVIDVMGNKTETRTEIIEITSKPAPANIYSVPAPFTKVPLNVQDLLQK